MNKELNDFIVLSRKNKISDEEIKNNLLSKGWDIKEIEESFFILSGGDKSQLKYSLQDSNVSKRKDNFASISLGLSFVGVVLLVLLSFQLLGLLLLIIGLIFGFMGIKSDKKIQAYIGIILAVLGIIYIVVAILSAIYLIKNNTNPFTKEKITDQEMINRGASEDTLKFIRGEKK